MFKLLRQLFSTLDKNHQVKVYKFQSLNMFQAFLEFLTLGLIAIYISLINDPNLINQNIYVKNIFENYFLNNFNNFLILYSIILICLIIFNFF